MSRERNTLLELGRGKYNEIYVRTFAMYDDRYRHAINTHRFFIKIVLICMEVNTAVLSILMSPHRHKSLVYVALKQLHAILTSPAGLF